MEKYIAMLPNRSGSYFKLTSTWVVGPVNQNDCRTVRTIASPHHPSPFTISLHHLSPHHPSPHHPSPHHPSYQSLLRCRNDTGARAYLLPFNLCMSIPEQFLEKKKRGEIQSHSSLFPKEDCTYKRGWLNSSKWFVVLVK